MKTSDICSIYGQLETVPPASPRNGDIAKTAQVAKKSTEKTEIKAGTKRQNKSGVTRKPSPIAIYCDLPDKLPISDAERRLFAAHFSAMIMNILVESS